MSRIRVNHEPGGWRVVDDGASAGSSDDWSRAQLVVGGPDQAELHRKQARENKAKQAPDVVAAEHHAYYVRNKATILAKQRERRRGAAA